MVGTEAFVQEHAEGVGSRFRGPFVAGSSDVSGAAKSTPDPVTPPPAQTTMHVRIDGQAAGVIALSDQIKESSPAAVRELHARGLRVVMLTGDNEQTAAAVARELGIDEYAAGVRPADKHERVRQLRAAGRVVAMAGDGVNDAPALAAADVGIAMSTGADVAIESAGVTLLGGDLRRIVRAIGLSRAVMRNVRQNLFLAFVYNVLAIPVAAGAFYPLTGLLLNPMIAAAAMSLSSLSVIGNALRLRTAGAAELGSRTDHSTEHSSASRRLGSH
jgi:Cu+-exporting ATPase